MLVWWAFKAGHIALQTPAGWTTSQILQYLLEGTLAFCRAAKHTYIGIQQLQLWFCLVCRLPKSSCHLRFQMRSWNSSWESVVAKSLDVFRNAESEAIFPYFPNKLFPFVGSRAFLFVAPDLPPLCKRRTLESLDQHLRCICRRLGLPSARSFFSASTSSDCWPCSADIADIADSFADLGLNSLSV